MGIFSSLVLVLVSVVTFANATIIKSDKISDWTAHVAASQTNNTASTKSVSFDYAKVSYSPTAEARNTDNFAFGANAGLIYDVNSAQILAEKNSSERLPMASLTKLVVDSIVLANHDPNEVVKVPKLPVLESDLAVAGIKEGMEFKLSDLAKASIISSSADATTAMALWDSGSEAKFIDKMNDFAKTWGLADTKFANPVGLDNENHYSSARDLLKIAQIALNNPTIAASAKTAQTIIYSKAGQPFNILSTNQLLGAAGIAGLKTGTTAKAGQCFIGYYHDNAKSMITVVLGSQNRFNETENMLNFASLNYNWI